MRLKGYLFSAFLASLFLLVGFSLMVTLIGRQRIVQFDHSVIAFIQGLETPSLTLIMKVFTFIGSFPSVVVIVLLASFFLYRVFEHRTELLLFVMVVVGTPIINQILKQFFQRVRPDFNRLIEIGGYSFPSGHAMNAFALYGILTFLFWRHIPTRTGRTVLILISSLFILMIGTSRVYLGVHYPSDIIGGYFASGLWLTSAIWFFQKYKDKPYKRSFLARNEG
jgi:undecaprenyl-diphosphatase